MRGDSTFATVTSTTINNNADNRLITGSGTANTLEAESTVTYDGTNLDLGDAKKIRLGASQDLQIYHDTESYIKSATASVNLILESAHDAYIKHGGENMIKCAGDGAVELYYDNSKKLETTSAGITITGAQTTSATGTFNGIIYAKSDDDSRIVCQVPSGNSDDWNYINFVGEDGTRDGFIGTWSDGTMTIQQDGATRMRFLSTYFEMTGHVYPANNNANDLGSSSLRWRNIYTTDLQLSNEGKTNDVDGTWGDYTIQEGESDLFLINNRSGKKYKFNLTEVS